MKSLILLFALFYLPFATLFAQDLEFTFQKKQSTFGLKLLSVDDDRFVAGFRGLYHPNGTLMMFDSLGNVLWEQSTDFDYLDHISDISMNPDTSFLVIGWSDGGDYISTAAIYRIDKNGNHLFDANSNNFSYPINFHCEHLIDDISLINNGIETSITNGSFIDDEFTFNEVVNDFEKVPELNTVLSAEEEGIFTYELITIFKEPTNYTFPVHQIKYGLDSTVVILDENSVKTLNEDFLITSNFPLPDSLNNFKIAVDDQQVYLIGKSESYQPYLMILNDTLGLKSYQPILSNYQIVNDIQIHNQQLLVIGDDHLHIPIIDFEPLGSYGHRDGMNAFVKSFDTLGNTQNYMIDIGVTNVETVGEIDYSNIDSCSDGSNGIQPTADILLPNTFVEITNFGDAIIHQATLNLRHRICPNPHIRKSWEYFEWTFTGLNLLAGESITLELGEIFFDRYPLAQDASLCFWTSIPNQKMDRNHSNDQYCHNYLISNSKEEDLLKNSVQVYPNPVTDKLFLNLEQAFQQDATVVLYNNFSQKIGSFAIPKGVTTKELNVQQLSPGIYFWTIILEDKEVAGRFLKL